MADEDIYYNPSDYYGGIPIFSAKGLHKLVAEKVVECAGKYDPILDVGTGGGALPLRLSDYGFEVIDAIDARAVQDPRSPIRKLYQLDLDGQWPDQLQNSYKVTICLEVIEHLENGRQLIRDLKRLTQPGGYILISTPNVEQPLSKLHFIKSGRFSYFLNDGMDRYGHISPMTEWEMVASIKSAGLDLKAILPAGPMPLLKFDCCGLKDSIMWSMMSLATCWSRNRSFCKLYVIRNPEVE
jgi:SAM-dependent methyltransferase